MLSSRPPHAPLSFDCSAKKLAYQYAQYLQPWRGNDLKMVFDALELKTQCGVSWKGENGETEESYVDPYDLPIEKRKGPIFKKPGDNYMFYIDANKGSDSNSGDISSPFRTIQRGIQAARTIPFPVTLYLRQGIFYLNETIKLNPADNFLTISNYQGEYVEINGGVPIQPNWKAYNVSNTQKVVIYRNANNVYSAIDPKSNTSQIKYLGDFSSTQDCSVNFSFSF